MLGTMELSEYELKRLENIRQNQKILESLQIPKPAILEKTVENSRTAASSKQSAAKKGAKPAKKAKPTRVSARLQAKLEEDQSGAGGRKSRRFNKEIVLLTELPEAAAPKPKRPRPLPGSKVPFEPEHGATGTFIRLMSSLKILDDPDQMLPMDDPPRMGIRNQMAVSKVLQERIYSVALHPSRENIIVATGGKEGHLAIWDATAVYNDHDPIAADVYKPKFFLFKPHSGSISTLRFSHGQLLSSGYEGSIQAMDMTRGLHETVYVASPDLDEQYISSFDHFEQPSLIGFSDMSGSISILDRRAPDSLKAYKLHEKKIGGMSISQVNPDRIATCSLDDTVCVWDRRMMKAHGTVPLSRFEYRRAVTAVNWHPTDPECLVSTCYDDNVRIHRSVLSDAPKELSIKHNNQTGRWITTFKAYWDPKSSHTGKSYVVIGDMNRGIDLIDGNSGVTHNFTSEYLTAQPAVNGSHPSLNLIASGNASGKLALWKPF